MQKPFSWKRFNQMAGVLETLGCLVAVFGPLIGIGLLIFGDTVLRISGVVVILASILVALYHISFSLLMYAIRDLALHAEPDSALAGETSPMTN